MLEWTTAHFKKHGSSTPRLDAEVLLAHARGCSRIQLYTDYDQELSEDVRQRMRELVQRRARHEPVAYLVGHREFFSLDLVVTPAVLIPRPETETLVVEALEALRQRAAPTVLDVGTGSGCIAIALAKHCPHARVWALDVSPQALQVAHINLCKHGVQSQITLVQSDLFSALEEGLTFDLIVSNPPYIPSKELPALDADVRCYEPRLALDGGMDGLNIIRRLLREALPRLQPQGELYLEISPEQANEIQQLAAEYWQRCHLVHDLSGHPRVLKLRKNELPLADMQG